MGAQASAVIGRAQQGAEQLLGAAGLSAENMERVVESIVGAGKEAAGTSPMSTPSSTAGQAAAPAAAEPSAPPPAAATAGQPTAEPEAPEPSTADDEDGGDESPQQAG